MTTLPKTPKGPGCLDHTQGSGPRESRVEVSHGGQDPTGCVDPTPGKTWVQCLIRLQGCAISPGKAQEALRERVLIALSPFLE